MKKQAQRAPANPMIPRKFSKAFVKELREDIKNGEHGKHIKEGCNFVVFKDIRDNGARLKLRLNKSGVASFFIKERFLGSRSPRSVNITGIDGDLDAITERAKQMQSNIVKGLDPEHTDGVRLKYEAPNRFPTLRQLHEDRMKNLKRKPGTVAEWVKLFNYLGDWKDRRINEITTSSVLRRHDKIKNQRTGPVADKCIKLVITLINWAINHPQPSYEVPTKNIVATTMHRYDKWHNKGGQTKRVSRAFPDYKWAEIWEAINDLRDRVPNRQDKKSPTLAKTGHYYFKFLMLSGMRDGTVAQIEWHQINLKLGTISWINEEDVAKKKTDQQIFDLPVCDYLWDMLKEMRADIVDETGKEPQGYLFKSLGKGHTPHVAVGMPKQWRIIKEQVGEPVNKLRAYDFRSTFISVGEAVGLSRPAVKTLIDHKKDDRDVLEGYTERSDALKRQHANKIANHILEHIGEKTKTKESTILPEYLMQFAQKAALKEDKTPEEVLARWARMGSQLDKLETDDPEILMIKNG